MKHNRILGGLIALVMFMITSVSAMAQEYELNSVTFLKPGEKGVISVSMNNPNTVDAFQGKIILPEGLTFVDTDTEGRGQISKTARTDKFSISLQKNSNKYIKIKVLNNNNEVFTLFISPYLIHFIF